MSALHINILPTDRSWAGDEPYEDPGPCSRCGVRLTEDEVPLLLWNASGRMWRYHFRCVGFAEPYREYGWYEEDTP